MEKGQEIALQAQKLFFKYGVKSVSMDDIASQLGISKKTLYAHFDKKADLVLAVCQQFFEHQQDTLCQANAPKENAIDEILRIYQAHYTLLRELHPSVIHDLQKYYPESWKLFLKYRDQVIYQNVKDNLQQGIREGVYRAEIDQEVIARIYVSRVESCMDPDLFPPSEFPLTKLLLELATYHIRGIATPKGIEYLEQVEMHN